MFERFFGRLERPNEPTLSYCIGRVQPLIQEFRTAMGPYADAQQAYALFEGLDQFLYERSLEDGRDSYSDVG